MSANGDPADRAVRSRSGRVAASACMSFLWMGGRRCSHRQVALPYIYMYLLMDVDLHSFLCSCGLHAGRSWGLRWLYSAPHVHLLAVGRACVLLLRGGFNGGNANFASPAHAASMHAAQVTASWPCVRRGEGRPYSRADVRVPVCSGAGETSAHGSLASETGARAGRGILPHARMAAHGSAVLSRGHAGRRQAAPLQEGLWFAAALGAGESRRMLKSPVDALACSLSKPRSCTTCQ